jgi:hypothetical protein
MVSPLNQRMEKRDDENDSELGLEKEDLNDDVGVNIGGDDTDIGQILPISPQSEYEKKRGEKKRVKEWREEKKEEKRRER